MNDKAFETPWHLVWCADVASQRLLHVSASVEGLLGLTPQALLDDPIQWNHAVLPADRRSIAALLPRDLGDVWAVSPTRARRTVRGTP